MLAFLLGNHGGFYSDGDDNDNDDENYSDRNDIDNDYENYSSFRAPFEDNVDYKSFNVVSDATIRRSDAVTKEVTKVLANKREKMCEIGPRVNDHLTLITYRNFVRYWKCKNKYAGRVKATQKELIRCQTIRQRRRGSRQYYTTIVCRSKITFIREMKRLQDDLEEEVHIVESPLRKPWTDNQVKALREGIDRHREKRNLFASILKDEDYCDVLGNRSNVALKDKARNLGIQITVTEDEGSSCGFQRVGQHDDDEEDNDDDIEQDDDDQEDNDDDDDDEIDNDDDIKQDGDYQGDNDVQKVDGKNEE
jgi:hypothetical protein